MMNVYLLKCRRLLPLAFLLASFQVLAQVNVTGKVTSEEDGQPLPGVSIVEKGTTNGTVTDAEGNYRITVPNEAILVFSFIGYNTWENAVNNQTVINVALQNNIQMLGEVMVVGYGTLKKRDLTGAVVQVDATKLENENPNNVQDILRANVPGVNVVGYGASAKGTANLEVRGQNSINAGTSPLIVVDGVIYYGDLADINPNDIDKIDVLKDASSAAVFGAKAASGVILITTKRGTSKPSINVNSNFGFVTQGVNQPVYQGEDFLSYRSDVMEAINVNHQPYQFSDPRTLPGDVTQAQWLAYDGSTGDPVDVWLRRLGLQPVEISNYHEGKSINWYDKVFQKGKRQDHTISISGKNDNTTYYWSVGYTKNEGLVVGDQFSTLRSRLNLDVSVTNYLSIGINTQFAARDESGVPADWTQITKASPWGSEFDAKGRPRYSPQDDPGGNSRSPFLANYYTNKKSDYYSIVPTLYAKVKLPLGFSYQMNFTPRLEWHRDFQHISVNHPDWTARGGWAQRINEQTYYWQIDNIFKWDRTFDKHHIDATFLINAEKYQFWSNTMSNTGFDPNDKLGYHNMGAGGTPTISSNDEYSTGDALMGRVFYSYADKYLLTVTVRRDGYSAFGGMNPRATFSSIGAGWTFSDEDFINADWLSNGKLRVSWGTNGNRDVGRYVALSDLSSSKYLYSSVDKGTLYTATQLYVNRMSNKGLKWEETKALNLGLDFGLFNNRLTGSIEAYKSNTTDLLVQRSLPDITGFSNVWDNLGEVENKGFEFTVNSLNVDRDNFQWNTTFNFSLNRNKILHLYGTKVPVLDANGNVIGEREGDDISNGWFIGHSIDEIWGYKTMGIWQQDQADEAAKYGVKPGDFRVYDKDTNYQFNNNDKVFLGHYKPRFRWSLRNEFKLFKSIDVSFMVYSLWGNVNTYNQAKNDYSSGLLLDRNNAYKVPYWTPERPLNNYARLNSASGGVSFNVYRKKSIIRLDNISVGYTLPRQIVDRAHIQRMKVFMTIRNVGFYAPQWKYWDPELTDGGGPTPRTYTFGIDLTL